MYYSKKGKNKFKISNVQNHTVNKNNFITLLLYNYIIILLQKNLSNTIKRPLHFLNFINKKENSTTTNPKSAAMSKNLLHKTSDGFIHNQNLFSVNKKIPANPINSIKGMKVENKMSLHKNTKSNKKTNSVTLSSESLEKASSQFLAYKYLRPNTIKDKYDIVMINKPYKSINTNNYIINTLNVSEKNFTNNSALEKKNYEKDLNKHKKEKEELDKKIKEQKSYIEQLIEKNKKLDEKYNDVSQENINIKKKYSSLKENQEQLIMLIKIIQENGVDVDGLIDKWNNEVENEEKENNESEATKSVDIEMIKEHKKYEFLPITVDDSKKSRSNIKGVPKLNFNSINKSKNKI